MKIKRMNMSPAKAVLTASCAVFVFAAAYGLGDCVLFAFPDELFKYLTIHQFIDIFSGRDCSEQLRFLQTESRMPFFMFNHYTGIPVLYFALGSVMLFGKWTGTFFAFKIVPVCFGLITLCSMFFVLRCWFGVWVAAVAVFLLATNYVYIYAVRCAYFREEVFQVAGLWLGLMLCQLGVKRRRRRKKIWFASGFFVFGLVLWAKVMFVAYMLSFAAALLFMGRERGNVVKNIFSDTGAAVIAGVSFVAGVFPLIWFNLYWGYPTFFALWGRLRSDMNPGAVSVQQWNNWNLLGNIGSRFEDVYRYVNGTLFADCVLNYSFPVLVSVSVCWAVGLCFLSRGSRLRLGLRAVIVFYITVLVLSCFVPDQKTAGHVLIIVPALEIICAVFIVWCFREARNIKTRFLLFLCLGLFAGGWCFVQVSDFQVFATRYKEGRFAGLYTRECDALVDWIKDWDIPRLAAFGPVAASSLYAASCDGPEIRVLGNDWEFELEIFCSLDDDTKFLLIHGKEILLFLEISRSLSSLGYDIQVIDSIRFRDRDDCSFELCRINR